MRLAAKKTKHQAAIQFLAASIELKKAPRPGFNEYITTICGRIELK